MYEEKEWVERGDVEAGRGDVVGRGEGRREAVKDVRRQVGLLAQEVERILPHAVRVTVSHMCTCNMSHMHVNFHKIRGVSSFHDMGSFMLLYNTLFGQCPD